MVKASSLEELWDSVPSGGRGLRPGDFSALPRAARQYLDHAIASEATLASAVRLRMHGEIKLKRWLPFTAEQVIHWGRGFIWSARVHMNGLPIYGFDQLVAGTGAMRWKLLGLIPVMTASGPDITRSAAGRVIAETVWLPSVLCGTEVSWTAQDVSYARAQLTVEGETAELTLTIDDRGGLKAVRLPRWGNPSGEAFHYVDFGGVVEEEARFGDYTIPSPYGSDTMSGRNGLTGTESFSAS